MLFHKNRTQVSEHVINDVTCDLTSNNLSKGEF